MMGQIHRHPSMSEYPKEKPATRTYSVLPARAVQDDNLRITTLRVLGAICIHTNAHGIAWPSLYTLARHVHVRSETVSRHVKKLVQAGYVRKLERKAYPMHIRRKSRGITNRYQVLFKGNDALPTREQFEAPRPKIVEEPEEQVETAAINDKRSGGPGDAGKQGEVIAHAFKRAVEAVMGQTRVASQSFEGGRLLAGRGVTAVQVSEATRAMCKDCMRTGRSAPKVVGQVAQWAGL